MAKVKLVDIAQERIREMIKNGEYEKNGFLPSEGELAIRFDMSRVTIREAVRSMEVRGFVERIHGKGVRVLDNSVDVLIRSITDMMTKEENLTDDLLVMRVIIEPEAASLAALNRTEDQVDIFEKYVRIMEKSQAMDEAYYEADLDFHVELAKASGNKLLFSFISACTNVLKDLIIITSKNETPLEHIYHYHRNIFEAIRDKNESAAFLAMQLHIEATYSNKDESYKSNI